MSKPKQSKGNDHPAPGDGHYWDDGEKIHGGNRDDCFTVHGDCDTVFGGNGDDRIVVIGDRNVAFGENGKDVLIAFGDWNRLDGGNGNDNLTARGDDNRLFGGNGTDCLVAVGEGNRLYGGNGVDRLTSVSSGGFFETGEGNVLNGGQGFDVFVLRNQSDLRVVNDEVHHAFFPPFFGEGVVSRGDIIRGVMDEITDYRAGERIVIGAKQEAHGPIELDDFAPNHKHLELGDGEYAFIRGDLIADGTFEVDRTGGDLLLVYDASGGGDALFLQGAVVLHGVTNPDSVFVC
ncbi:calcium-binding protein [Neoroseomonas soli]|uniref:Calcium-binding protein n=1 Tax=Neoroseomonas soli TaxID=1081025 RepID=A0A9X9X367_9PROT|nr:hypothetical protein [Neoroseomonas soli]MBR0673846.1 calcium-binding protein [Neoroseomonas soli]